MTNLTYEERYEVRTVEMSDCLRISSDDTNVCFKAKFPFLLLDEFFTEQCCVSP